MGRREAPVDPDAGPVQRFAYELRTLRQKSGGPTYRTMAQGAGYSVTALSQAAKGDQLPTLPVALAYAEACGGDPREWETRWQEAADEVAAQPRTESTGESPYRGLARFEASDAGVFFGRDDLVGLLVDMARGHRFTAVFGPSGSGKSSLLRAGLISRLQRPRDGEPRPAALRILTPGDRPLHTHGERLTPPAEADGDTWLVVDQFEEVYTLCRDPEERKAFLDRLLAAQRPGSRIRVVIAVRADFLGRCAEHAGLTASLQSATLFTGPMSRDELREAVVKPAATAGLIVERSLTSRILDEVEGEPGALPLLSHALLETWRHRKSRALTESAYEAAGGLRGAIAHTADEVYAQLSGEQADLARRILLRLVTPGDGTPDTRRPTDRAELELGDPQDTATVVESLVRARLLTLDDGRVDLAHEALITAWPRLRSWIEAERDRLRVHRRLTEAARAWRELGRDPGALYRGSRLAGAGEAFPAASRQRDLTALEGEFLAASVRQRQRALRLRRTVTAVLAVLVLIASGTAVVAFQQRETAQAQRNTALFHQITAKANELRDASTSLSAQLDLTAYRMRHTQGLRTQLISDAGEALSTRLPGHRDIVGSVAYSADGEVLASGSYDGTVRLWDVSGQGARAPLGKPLTGHEGPVAEVAFSPDGRVLATSGQDGTVRLWDLRKPAHPAPLGGPLNAHEGTVAALAFGPDGDTLATGGDDSKLRLWDLRRPAAPEPLGEPLTADARGVRSVAFSPDGETLASAGFDTTVRLWDIARPKHPDLLGEPLRAHSEPVWSVAFSPDGDTLASAGFDTTVRLWDVARPERARPLGEPLTDHDDSVTSVAFSPDGTTLASAGYDDKVRLWNVANPEYPLPLGEPLSDHSAGIWSVAFSPDGRGLASGAADHTVRLWHRPGTVLAGQPHPLNDLAYGPRGRLLATAGSDGYEVRLWQLREGRRPQPMGQPLTGHEGRVLSLAFRPGGRVLASGGEDGTVRLWDLRHPDRPEPLGEPLTSHEGQVLAVGFGPGGDTLATTDEEGTVRLWDVSRPDRPAALADLPEGHEDDVTAVAFSPDGKTLATTGDDKTVRLWDVRDPAAPTQLGDALTGHTNLATDVAFSPDGRLLASAATDRTVRLWNVADPAHPEPLATLTGHTGEVSSVAFSPDGDTLASASDDQTVRLWKITGGKDGARPYGTPLTGHIGYVAAVEFAPDGRTLATASYDTTARLWHLGTDRALRRVCATTRGELTARQWQRHVPHSPFDPPCPR